MAVQRLSSSLNCFLLRGLPWATSSPRARTSGDSFSGDKYLSISPGWKRNERRRVFVCVPLRSNPWAIRSYSRLKSAGCPGRVPPPFWIAVKRGAAVQQRPAALHRTPSSIGGAVLRPPRWGVLGRGSPPGPWWTGPLKSPTTRPGRRWRILVW